MSVKVRYLTEAELLICLGRPMFGDPVAPWCEWFAWYPVRTIDARWTWLRTILRRRYTTKANLPGPSFDWWTYARGDRYPVNVK